MLLPPRTGRQVGQIVKNAGKRNFLLRITREVSLMLCRHSETLEESPPKATCLPVLPNSVASIPSNICFKSLSSSILDDYATPHARFTRSCGSSACARPAIHDPCAMTVGDPRGLPPGR